MTDRMIHDRPATTDDPDAQVRRALHLMREGRADLSPMRDRGAWNAAPDGVQDVVIREVAHRLAERFEWVGTRRYECACEVREADVSTRGYYALGLGPQGDDEFRESFGRLTYAHRLGVFKHRATGIEMVMVPGRIKSQCLIHADDPEGGDRLIENLAMLIDITGHGDQLRSAQCACRDPIPPLLVARWPVTHGQSWSTSQRHGVGDTSSMYEAMNTPLQDLPVTGASHADVCEWLSYSPGLRLPTASEWEHAARAGTTTRFYWGEEMDDGHCWHAGNSGGWEEWEDYDSGGAFTNRRRLPPRPHAPAEHDAAGRCNAFGLVDCIGNVWEWCDRGRAVGLSYTSTPSLDPYDSSFPIGEDGDRYDVGFRPVSDIPGWAEVQP